MRARLDGLRAQERVDVADLELLWDACDVLAAEDLLGSWRGFGLSTGHRMGRVLERSGWHGKRFESLERVAPLVMRGSDGELFDDEKMARGGASVWEVRFRGRVTATMVYDAMPVLDHFVRIDEGTVLGVMNGTADLVRDDGQLFWLALERE